MSSTRDVFTPTYHASYALVVGIDQYNHLQPLRTAVHGAQAVAGYLQDTLGFAVTELYDAQSNREVILRWFGQLNTHPDDRVIFYFAGHGVTQNIKNRSKGFLALANSDGYWNSLAMDEILDEAEALPAKHVLYLLDACFSGLALRGRAADFGVSRTLDYLLTRPARYAITAGGEEVVDDDAAGEYSLFTHVLLQAFSDKALQADGVLRAKEVGLFIEENVSAHRRSRALPNHGYLHGSGDGDFIFAWQTGPRLPVDLEMALRSDVAEVRWGAVAALIHIIRDENVGELAAVARERLETLSHSDPDNRVRAAAQSLFDEEEALCMAEQERIRHEEAAAQLEEARGKQKEAMRQAREANEQLNQAQRWVEKEQELKETAEQTRKEALDQAMRAREITPVPHVDQMKPIVPTVREEPDAAYAPAEHKPHPKPAQPRPVQKQPRNWVPFAIGGGIIAVALIIGGLVLSGALGGGSGKTPEPTQQVTGSTLATPTTRFFATSTQESTLTAGKQAYTLAKAGVTRNADWTPYTEEIEGVLMALVPAGCFQMGSNSGNSNEQPVHEVCFTKPFWIDVYEVTQAQFTQFGGKALSDSSWKGDNRPREYITWDESVAFCENRGVSVRLPTEAEWEYVARGPDGLTYPWGNELIDENVVYYFYSNGYTRDVGSKPAGVSWVGALDMLGNVSEWVADWYGTYPLEPQVNPDSPNSGEYRVRRGYWSFFNGVVNMSSMYRGWEIPSHRDYSQGFRCARSY